MTRLSETAYSDSAQGRQPLDVYSIFEEHQNFFCPSASGGGRLCILLRGPDTGLRAGRSAWLSARLGHRFGNRERIIGKDRRKPAFGGADIPALAGRIVRHLIAPDPADGKVDALRMREI